MAGQAGVDLGGNGKHFKPVAWHEYRCASCGALLFRANLPIGARIQIRCWRRSCKRMAAIHVKPEPLAAIDLSD